MEKEIVKTDPMNRQLAHHVSVELAPSSARTAVALPQQQSVTVQTTAVMVLMNKTATCHVPNSNSSAAPTDVAFSTAGNATAIPTAKTAQTKILPYVTNVRAIRKRNFHVKMVAAYRNSGCATLTMIVGTIQTNQLTCVVKETARRDGNAARAEQTTDAFRNGCSATGKTIVVTIPTNSRRTVLHAILRQISNVRIIGVCRNSGSVTLRMIVETVLMKRRICAKETTGSVRNPNLDVTMVNAFRLDGVAIMRMIAVTILMRSVAAISNARMEHSSVLRDIA